MMARRHDLHPRDVTRLIEAAAARHRADADGRTDEEAEVDLELDGKVAVVTGASKGIGLAVVRALAAEGLPSSPAPRTVDALDGHRRRHAVAVDLAAPDGPERLVREAVDRHGRVDVLVNNVGGVQLRLDGFLSVTDEDFERSLQLNFFAALRATRAAVRTMLERREAARSSTSHRSTRSSTPTAW